MYRSTVDSLAPSSRSPSLRSSIVSQSMADSGSLSRYPPNHASMYSSLDLVRFFVSVSQRAAASRHGTAVRSPSLSSRQARSRSCCSNSCAGARFCVPEDFLILLPATEIVPTTGLRFFCGRATLFPQILIEQSAVIDPRPPNFTTGNDSGLRQPRVCVGMNVQKFSRLGERHGFTHGTLA